MVLSHFGTSLAVGAVVQVHCQPAWLHMSVDLPLPVVDQRGRTDDQSAFRNHQAGVCNKQAHQNFSKYKVLCNLNMICMDSSDNIAELYHINWKSEILVTSFGDPALRLLLFLRFSFLFCLDLLGQYESNHGQGFPQTHVIRWFPKRAGRQRRRKKQSWFEASPTHWGEKQNHFAAVSSLCLIEILGTNTPHWHISPLKHSFYHTSYIKTSPQSLINIM